MASFSPSFQLYANDWLSSPTITLMTSAEEGAYIRLLCIAWNNDDCGLPDNDDQLAILSRLGQQWHEGSGAKIRECFHEINGRLFNGRLLKERKKQEQRRKQLSKAGKASAEARGLTGLEKSIADFREHRRQMRRPLTDEAEKRLRAKLERMAPGDTKTQLAIVDQSIENGWQGVFELKRPRDDDDDMEPAYLRPFED